MPARHREGRTALGRWIALRRHLRRVGLLTPEQTRFLESLPGWTWGKDLPQKQTPFERVLPLLKRFVKREGHARVPLGHCEGGVMLGRWVGRYRRLHKDGQLSRERESQLEAVPGWTWAPLQDAFHRGFRRLEDFVEREGHARVPTEHLEGDFHLGHWVGLRRRQYLDGRLPRGARKRLEAFPGWLWEAKRGLFEEKLRLLLRFAKREGHTRVPRNHRECGFQLGVWVANRRYAYWRKELAAARILAFEAVPHWSWKVGGSLRSKKRTRR